MDTTSCGPKSSRAHLYLLAKKIIKVGRVFETERKPDLRDVQCRMFEHGLGFADKPVEYMFGGRLARLTFDHPIEVIDMHQKPIGKVLRRSQRYPMRRQFHRELAIQQLQE